ncbi:aldo-keto reductase 1 [Spatholobus suberectus]|nr:aldo-keto reductase 1 [Spatholobus suberectus]
MSGHFTCQAAHHPRFQAENIDKNKSIYDRIESLAKKHQCTPPQLALAWVLHQGDDVVPIPVESKEIAKGNSTGNRLTEEKIVVELN